MSKPPRFSKCSWIIIPFFVIFLSLPAIAEPLELSEIDALQAQLITARAVDKALSNRFQCYVDKDISLQSYSSQLQQQAGDLHRQEQNLSRNLSQAEFEAKSFRDDFETSQQEVNRLRADQITIRSRIEDLENTLNECKSYFFMPSFLCDVAGELSGLNGSLRDLEGAMQATNVRANASLARLNQAKLQVDEARTQLKENKNSLTEAQQERETIEGEIKVIKEGLSEIRMVKQDYSSRRQGFEQVFDEIKNLDPNSDRRSVTRRLRRESEDLGDLLIKAQNLLDKNGVMLPNGDQACAN